MAKGTKFSDVNYSVPEGADPLGIGVPDLGRSSYDPIATARQGWENMRQERMMNREMDQQNYQSYLKNMPTPEGVNQKITRSLNKDLGKMGDLFQQKQRAGGFEGFAKGPGGDPLSEELAVLENKVASDIPMYNNYSAAYTKDVGVMRNPNNMEKIDWELTNKNVEAMNEADNVNDFAQPFINNGGSLVVMKPEPVDVMTTVTDKLKQYMPEEMVQKIRESWDPNMNKMRVDTIEGVDPAMLERNMLKVYDDMQQPGYEKYSNAIASAYRNAPETEKVTDDKIPIDEKAWFVGRYSPEYADRIKRTYVAKAKDVDEEQPSGLGAGIPRINGEIDTDAMMEPIIMKVSSTTAAQYKDRRFGKGQKKIAEEATTAEETEFESFNMPLTGIDEVFDAMTPADAIDTSTGTEPDRTKIGSHKAASTSYMPTYNGESDIPVEIEVTDEAGNKKTKKYIVKPGKPIPMVVQKELIKKGIPMSYEPYLLTRSVYGAAQEEKAMGAISWSDYVSKHGKTVITPWASINNAFLTKMGAEEYQIQELQANMLEMYNKLNRTP